MRVGFVRNVGLAALSLAVVVLGACNDDPLSFDNDKTTDIFVNPSYMVVEAGGESKLVSRTINQGLEPTFAEIDPGAPTCVTVAEDPDATELQPPGLFVVTGGFQLGSCVITLTSGGVSRNVDVTVVGADIELTCPSGIRVGDSGQITARLVGADDEATTVEPFDQATDLTWASDDATVVAVTEDGSYSAPGASGAATIVTTWSYTDGSTAVATRQSSCTITVSGSTPDSAAFADAVDGSLGSIEAGAPVSFDVVVFDEFGNLTFLPEEITGITVTSSDLAIATATGIREVLTESEVALSVDVDPLTAGEVTLSGTVQTTAGDLPFEATLEIVLTPTITTVTPASGGFGGAVVIDGSNFDGLTALLIDNVDYSYLIESSSATSITFKWPDVGVRAHEIVVQTAGASSAPATYTQDSDVEAHEPENEDPGTTTATMDAGEVFVGAFGTFEGDIDDWIVVTVAADGDYAPVLHWNTGQDLDLLVYDSDLNNICFSYYSQPEDECGTIALTAGTYYVLVEDFSALVGDVQQSSYGLRFDPVP